MTKFQILDAIRLMPPQERLEIIEFALTLIREEKSRTDVDQTDQRLSLADAAEVMASYYSEGGELTEFTDLCQEDFCEYKDYA